MTPDSGTAVGQRIDIVSDAICPWCYIGKRQLERALAMLASEGCIFRSIGTRSSSIRTCRRKAATAPPIAQ